MPDACGCILEKGKLTYECEYHKKRDKLVKNRTTLFLEAKIRGIFSSTHLREIEDEIITVVRNIREN